MLSLLPVKLSRFSDASSTSRKGSGHAAFGFSLVEIVMALGVVSFAIVAIMGMIPVGLASLRQSMDETAKAHIVQSIVGEMQLSGFSGGAGQTRYFDEAGSRVEPTDVNWQYRVKWQCGLDTEVKSGGGSLSLPGSKLLVGIEARNLPPKDPREWSVTDAPDEIFIHSAMVVSPQ